MVGKNGEDILELKTDPFLRQVREALISSSRPLPTEKILRLCLQKEPVEKNYMQVSSTLEAITAWDPAGAGKSLRSLAKIFSDRSPVIDQINAGFAFGVGLGMFRSANWISARLSKEPDSDFEGEFPGLVSQFINCSWLVPLLRKSQPSTTYRRSLDQEIRIYRNCSRDGLRLRDHVLILQDILERKNPTDKIPKRREISLLGKMILRQLLTREALGHFQADEKQALSLLSSQLA